MEFDWQLVQKRPRTCVKCTLSVQNASYDHITNNNNNNNNNS